MLIRIKWQSTSPSSHQTLQLPTVQLHQSTYFDNTFKLECMMTLNTYVPSKMTSSRHSQTWCNRFIRHLTRRKRRAYRKARLTKSDDDWKNTGLSNRKSRNNAKQPMTHMSGTLLQRTSLRSCSHLWSQESVTALGSLQWSETEPTMWTLQPRQRYWVTNSHQYSPKKTLPHFQT